MRHYLQRHEIAYRLTKSWTTDAIYRETRANFKDAMLGRFYAICNCCACCCGAMQDQRNGIPMLAASGCVSQVDEAACLGCGLCAESCQFGAISLPDSLAVINPARCMGCGVCVSRCPQEALSLRRERGRGSPLELDDLLGYDLRPQ